MSLCLVSFFGLFSYQSSIFFLSSTLFIVIIELSGISTEYGRLILKQFSFSLSNSRHDSTTSFNSSRVEIVTFSSLSSDSNIISTGS